ncbi:universal stress protein [Streptomyces sp. V4-01]|uniref:Universal stress protein n=1 Tax=Actinacidiphila polyblastidii TaxID=3110430 RepID=A0ABU7PD83_9ACTN|nr:universal stress protein [Streptomyces sp. V4-01]
MRTGPAVEVRRRRDAAWPEFLEDSALHLSDLLAGHRERYPDVAVRHEILSGEPAASLASAARYARCLVVGSRGRGGFRGTMLGSTSRSLVHRTYCPLLVTPSPPDA